MDRTELVVVVFVVAPGDAGLLKSHENVQTEESDVKQVRWSGADEQRAHRRRGDLRCVFTCNKLN